MLPTGHRLTRRAEFQALYRKGRTWSDRLLTLKVLPNSSSANRFGFAVSKAVGGAVCRNRVKRRLREIVRRAQLKQGWDILIVARQASADCEFREMEQSMAGLFHRPGLAE